MHQAPAGFMGFFVKGRFLCGDLCLLLPYVHQFHGSEVFFQPGYVGLSAPRLPSFYSRRIWSFPYSARDILRLLFPILPPGGNILQDFCLRLAPDNTQRSTVQGRAR
jgi:hypothetical protein